MIPFCVRHCSFYLHNHMLHGIMRSYIRTEDGLITPKTINIVSRAWKTKVEDQALSMGLNFRS